MIITDNQSVKRCDFIFVKLKFQKVERQVKKIEFPLYGAIKDNFAEIEGGERKFGKKSIIKSDRLFESLNEVYQIKSKDISTSNLNNPFEFPLDAINNEINPKQPKYFFPDQTYQENCSECNGRKYIKCQNYECNGRHNWTCTDCRGDGKVPCKDCNGNGKNECKNCSGHGNVNCGSGVSSFLKRNVVGNIAGGGCGGTGKVKDKDAPSGLRRCKTCHGKGVISCEDCRAKGEVNCDTCRGRGECKCSKCKGKGDITCSECYGDREKYGKIDCSQCKTIGTMAQVVFVESFISKNENEKIILQGDKLIITDSDIQKHIKPNAKTELVYKKVNDDLKENYDEYSKIYAETIEKDLGLNKDRYPLLTKEEIYYQVVPCIELLYKHMLTNTSHKFTIINFYINPEIIFHSEPEQLKKSLDSTLKAIGDFFRKLFKTKSFKIKEDKRKEIVLLIHLAKIDGKIENQEKVHLSEMIGSLDNFTNSERQKLFDIMNTSALPELTNLDVTFSSEERSLEVLSKLTELAYADGEIELAEKALIEKIKNMM